MSTTVDLGKITASVTVGTTTTGAAGTNASVSNSGTTQDAVLNFTIPRGAQGVQGPQGSTGPQGPAGPTGPQGPMGDVAVITPEQQAAFTMYSAPGQNTDGPMTQKAVTDALGNIAASNVSYDNSESGLTAENVQDAIDELNRVHKIESVINLSSFSVKNGFLASSNVWIIPNANRVNNHICFSVQQGEWYSITAKSNSNTGYAFLNSDQIPSTNLQSIDLVSGTSIVVVPAGKTITFQVPSNCYLAINSGNVSNRDHIPSSFCQVSEPVSINEGLNEIETIIEPLTNIPFFSESANWDIINTNEIRGALLDMKLLRGEVPQGAYIKYFGRRTGFERNFAFTVFDNNGNTITAAENTIMPSSGIVKFTTKGSCSFEVTINTSNLKTVGTKYYDWASSNLFLNEKYFLNKKYSLPFFAHNANWDIINTNEIYGTLIELKLIRGEVPQGSYIKYFGSRDTNPSQLTIHVYDNNNNRISSGLITNALEDGMLQTFYMNGLCAFKVTVNASKRDINTGGTFRDWGTDLLLNSEYLKVEGTPKRIVCFGDSITQFLDTEQSLTYPDYLARLSGCDVFNAGIGGTRLARRATPTATISNETQARAAVDIPNLVSAWINNDWEIVDAAVTWLYNNNHSHDYRAKIAALKTIDPNEVDIVTIFGGTNDFMGDSKLGIAGSTAIDEVAGGLEVMFNLIQTANKAIEIFVFCPIVRYINNDRTSPYWSDNYTSSGTNLNGKKLPDIADFIESVSQYHHIPCRNWYWDLGWNPFNFSEYFNANDGTHPYKGMDYIGEKMYLYLKTKTKFTK